MKKFIVQEVVTSTILTEYQIEAEDEADARERFRFDGQYLGDCSTAGPDGIKVIELGKKK